MKKNKSKPRLFLKAIGLYILPIPVFIVFMILSSPLRPHCSIGNGMYGCTPICEPTGYMADGRPSNYKEVPCFHGDPSSRDQFMYDNFPYVLGGLLILLIAIYLMNKKRFKKYISWMALGPLKLFGQNLKNKKIVSKVIVFLAAIPLVAIWVFGYFYVAKTLAGKPLVANINQQATNQTKEIHIIEDRKQCDEKWSISNAKNCTWLVVRDDGGHGTGFSVISGYLVTNYHVIEGAGELKTWINGELMDLIVWNYSPIFDLAILKLPSDVPTCSWFSSSEIELAETLYAIGWPQSQVGESTVTRGIYSRTNAYEDGIEFIQTDAPINPGNSGGPLINECGVVGINTLKESWSNERLPRPLEGLSNALSSDSILKVIQKLIDEGSETEIPSSRNLEKSNTQPAQTTITIDISVLRDHLSTIRSAKESWKSTSGCPQDKISKINDLFDRQINFCDTLIERIGSNNGVATQDDLIMWDAVVKMSYESSLLADELNSTCWN